MHAKLLSAHVFCSSEVRRLSMAAAKSASLPDWAPLNRAQQYTQAGGDQLHKHTGGKQLHKHTGDEWQVVISCTMHAGGQWQVVSSRDQWRVVISCTKQTGDQL
eukprot:scaffold180458_cov18-Tisochrysis_lutea.AAC.1